MHFGTRVRIFLNWLKQGAPLWVFLLALVYVIVDARLWTIVVLAKQCAWPETFGWAGAALQIAGLFPVAEGLRRASQVAPEGSPSQRIIKWLRDLAAAFLPFRVAQTAGTVSLSATVNARGSAHAQFLPARTLEQRLGDLESAHRELQNRYSTIAQEIQGLQRATNERIEAQSATHRRQINNLRALFLELAASGIGWAYAGLALVVVGVLLSTFPTSVPGFSCP
jgi:hypothetical protein